MADVAQKYLQECQLMSSLRHPNITQFLGICFFPGTQLPLLVTEHLETSLDDLLEIIPNLPLSLKCSVLVDVASGLLYLHKRPSPVIHRDLTAKNVLLTSSLVAKITNMGNSRLVSMRPGQMAKTLSLQYPGTSSYMPPEAREDSHQYGLSFDIFSFGHLALYTLTQVRETLANYRREILLYFFFQKFLCNLFTSSDNLKQVKGRTVVECLGVYVETLEGQLGSFNPSLVQLVKQCLHNEPGQRPSTDALLVSLQRIRLEVEGEYGRDVVQVDLVQVKLAKELMSKDKKIQEQVTSFKCRFLLYCVID